MERIPNTCSKGKPCKHSIFAGAWWLGVATRGEAEKTRPEIVAGVEEWANVETEQYNLDSESDALVQGYLDGRTNARFRFNLVREHCTAY